MIGAGAVRLELVVEAEEMRAQGRVQRAVGDLDRLDGLRLRRKHRPQIERREQVPGRRRQRERAGILASAAASHEPARHRSARCGSLAARAWQARARASRPTKPPPAITTSSRSPASCLASRHRPAMPRSAWRVNLLKGEALVTKGLAHEPRAGNAALHPRHRDARGKSVPRA